MKAGAGQVLEYRVSRKLVSICDNALNEIFLAAKAAKISCNVRSSVS